MGFGSAMHCEAGLCVLGLADVRVQSPLSATYRGNCFVYRLMIEYVGGVQSGVHRRVVAPGAYRNSNVVAVVASFVAWQAGGVVSNVYVQ